VGRFLLFRALSTLKPDQTMTNKSPKNPVQELPTIKGRAMLEWYGKSTPNSIEWFPAQETEVYGNLKAKDFNKLFWGDNKQVLSHLLKEYRGEVDLIYIDPPFDSKADYVKKVKLNGERLKGVDHNVLEQMQYTDMWEKDEYLQFMYERLIILRELLSDTGSIYLHCDWHKNSHLRLLMDEVFGSDNFRNEVIWHYFVSGKYPNYFARDHDNILVYAKTSNPKFNYKKHFDKCFYLEKLSEDNVHTDENGEEFYQYNGEKRTFNKQLSETWKINKVKRDGDEKTGYPTQKPEELLELILNAASDEGDLVLDCFSGSGTTLAVAEKLRRRWIGCDINKGAIITTTERINKIIEEKIDNETGFKVYNVNHYDVFNNDIQAKQLLFETYRIEELTRGEFDGTLGNDYVKVISPNRVLSKADIAMIIEDINKNISLFEVKTVSKQKETTFANKVIVICSGTELDVRDFINKENKTGVEIEVRDIQVDKKELDFKQPTEATIKTKVKGKRLTIEVQDYYSPLLMKRLELENEGRLSMDERVNVFDYRQAIEHIVIDVNYGEGQKSTTDISFNAEAFLHTDNDKGLVKTTYEHTYEKAGKYTVAVKIVDVLGEEYFETQEVTVK
jgi:DNA modification methylase